MDYLGLFCLGCLGCFIGALVTYGLPFVNAVQSWQSFIATIIAAVFTGVVIAFVDRFRTSKAVGAYAVGLLVALMWAYSSTAVKLIRDTTDNVFPILGWAQLAGTVVVTVVAVALVLPPAFRDAWRKDS